MGGPSGHMTTDTLEGLLLNHRRVLIAYMEEWSKQQEKMLFSYANSTENGNHEVVVDSTPAATAIVEKQWPLFSERAVCGEKVPVGNHAKAPEKTSTGDGAASDAGSPVISRHLPFEGFETEGIKAALPTINLEMNRVTGPHHRHKSGGRVTRLVESSEFGFAISGVILCNVVFMAIAADHMLESAQKGRLSTETYIVAGEIVFTGIYVVELILKLYVYGCSFFYGFEWQWHVFDMIVVLAALADLIAPLFVTTSINISCLRVNRLIKLVKMLRVVTVYRSFKELRLIIASILGCVKTMFWAIALLGTVLFTFSLLFVQAVTEYVKVESVDQWNEEIMSYWGSTGVAMITLFQSSTGGEDWGKVAMPLWDLGWVYYGAFMLYICFFMFIVVNILTALFVDAALSHSLKDDTMVIQEEMSNKQEYVKLLKALYRRLDHDGSGEISWKEFEAGLHSPDMLAFASALQIEISDIHEFFRLISADGREVINIENFVIGCMKLRGSAKSIDVVSLMHKTKQLEHVTESFAKKADRHLKEVERLIKGVKFEQERNHETAKRHFPYGTTAAKINHITDASSANPISITATPLPAHPSIRPFVQACASAPVLPSECNPDPVG